MKSGKIYVPMPKGLHLPEGTKDGQTVELLTEFKVEGNRLCLLKIEDAGMDSEGDESGDDDTQSPDSSSFMDAYKGVMNGGGPAEAPQDAA
jgi:hypothetical protein